MLSDLLIKPGKTDSSILWVPKQVIRERERDKKTGLNMKLSEINIDMPKIIRNISYYFFEYDSDRHTPSDPI